MSEKFKGIYTVNDGYSGSETRPHYFQVDEDDIESYFNKEDLRSTYQSYMQESFQERFIPVQENEDEFVKWGKKIIIEKLKKKLEEEE